MAFGMTNIWCAMMGGKGMEFGDTATHGQEGRASLGRKARPQSAKSCPSPPIFIGITHFSKVSRIHTIGLAFL